VAWAAHPGNILALAERLSKAGIASEGPTPGSRKRPDGRVVAWKTLHLKDDEHGLLPFFIEWSADSVHPSLDAPKGCSLKKLWVESAEPAPLAKRFAAMGLEVAVRKEKRARLCARIAGPKEEIELSG